MNNDETACYNLKSPDENESTHTAIKSVADVRNNITNATDNKCAISESKVPAKKSKTLLFTLVTSVVVLLVGGFIVGSLAIVKVFLSPKVDFEEIYDKCDLDSPWADVGRDGSYLEIDTNPYDLDDGDYTTSVIAWPAIEDVNDELGLPSYLYRDMGNVTALQGKQTETFEDLGIEVSYSFHPDNGLEVIYKLIE